MYKYLVNQQIRKGLFSNFNSNSMLHCAIHAIMERQKNGLFLYQEKPFHNLYVQVDGTIGCHQQGTKNASNSQTNLTDDNEIGVYTTGPSLFTANHSCLVKL